MSVTMASMRATPLEGIGELIAAIPSMLGHMPFECVVTIGVNARGEIVTAARIDRSDLVGSAWAEPLARRIVMSLRREGAQTIVAVSFTRDDVRVSCPGLDVFAAACDEARLPFHAWAAVGGRYFAPGCAHDYCCPARGRAIPAVRGHGPYLAFGFQHEPARIISGRGRMMAESRRRRAARAGDRWLARKKEPRWAQDSLERWISCVEEARHSGLPADAEAGKIIAAAQATVIRDAMIVSLTPGGVASARRAARGTRRSADIAHAMERVLAPSTGVPPDPRIVDAAWAVLDHLTRLARQARRAPLLTIGAVVAWWEGNASDAADLARAALAIEPQYRLAELLITTIDMGIEPGWRRAA